MLRRYRLYAREPGGRLTEDRLKYELASNKTRMEFVVRAATMREARRMVREHDWAEGPDEPGLLRVRKGQSTSVEWAPYLAEQLET